MKRATISLIRLNHAMHCYVCYWYAFVVILNHFRDLNLLFRMCVIRTLHIDMSKDKRIRGYFSRRKGVRERKSLRNIGHIYVQSSPGSFKV
jgi:hypothetical protein